MRIFVYLLAAGVLAVAIIGGIVMADMAARMVGAGAWWFFIITIAVIVFLMMGAILQRKDL